ncbi:MAG: hypothetical protein JWM16_1179 [Verrucomicrobiales bacterium]|nr:hypothetical protein [Verrucomicrobiales bacterium]
MLAAVPASMAPQFVGKSASCNSGAISAILALVRLSFTRWAAGAFFFSALGGLAHAETLDLRPVADTTLIETQPDNNMGGQVFFSAGTTQNYPRVRGLVRFDVTGLPAGSTINAVTLTLEMVRQPRDGYNSTTIGLQRMLQGWGEGNKANIDPNSPGLGSPASPGEATWNARAFGSHLWAAPGGAAGVDYSGNISSSLDVYGTGDSPYTFPSDTGLTDDVAFWQSHPELNHGWMIKALDEDINFTARRYASREDPDFAPTLHIDYTVVPEPKLQCLLGLGTVLLLGMRLRKGRQ